MAHKLLLLAALLVCPCWAHAAKPSFHWQNGQLLHRQKVSPLASKCVSKINILDFKSALQLAKGNGWQDPLERIELTLAIAGHLDNDQPQLSLDLAQSLLKAAKTTELLALRNQVEVYRTLHAVKLPWAKRSPGHSWVPSPQLLPARDLVRAGNLNQARQRIGEMRRAQMAHLLSAWQFAAFFEGDDKYKAQHQVVVRDLRELLKQLSQSTDKDVKDASSKLSRLLDLAQRESWAQMTVPTHSLLYGRAMMEPMRAYYWWWRQMGNGRPMAKQGFQEILTQLKARFPRSPIVKVYAGQRVPWGKELVPKAYPGAPQWAVNQCELRARVTHVVRWWFQVRQQPDGQLGGGWEDDCEALRRFAIAALVWDDAEVIKGIRRLTDGIWTSGQLANGFDKTMKDVEHSSEMAADTSVILGIDYGDPHQFERFLQTCKTIDEVHFGRNKSGRRQFKGMVLSATRVDPNPRTAYDVLYSGRAMRPVAMVAWYSRNPRAVKLLRDWATTWTAAAIKEADGKPAGVFPAAIRFGDEGLKGHGSWYDPGLGGLYRWNPQDLDMVWGKVLLAHHLTGDPFLLRGIEAQLKLQREAFKKTPVKSAGRGTRGWVIGQLRNHFWLPRWYRSYTGRGDYDDLIGAGGGYGRFAVSAGKNSRQPDWSAIRGLHTGELNQMRFNLPMITTEVRGTDRINLFPFSLVGAMTGSHVDITQSPNFAVTWKNVSTGFAALVADHSPKRLRAWVVSLQDKGEKPVARLWQLQPGWSYRVRLSADVDQDGQPDGKPILDSEMRYQSRRHELTLPLPGRKTCLLEIERKEKNSPETSRKARLPDLAVSPQDVVFADGKLSVTVHNIGSAAAKKISVIVGIYDHKGKRRLDRREASLDKLEFPHDLIAKRRAVEFTIPLKPGNYKVVAFVAGKSQKKLNPFGDHEITYSNNRVLSALHVRERRTQK